jgi:hypothetical protein
VTGWVEIARVQVAPRTEAGVYVSRDGMVSIVAERPGARRLLLRLPASTLSALAHRAEERRRELLEESEP